MPNSNSNWNNSNNEEMQRIMNARRRDLERELAAKPQKRQIQQTRSSPPKRNKPKINREYFKTNKRKQNALKLINRRKITLNQSDYEFLKKYANKLFKTPKIQGLPQLKNYAAFNSSGKLVGFALVKNRLPSNNNKNTRKLELS